MSNKEVEEFLIKWDALIKSSVLYGSRQFNIALKASIREVLNTLAETQSIAFVSQMGTTLVSEIPIAITMQRFLERVNDKASTLVYKEYLKVLPDYVTSGVTFGNVGMRLQLNEYINSQGAMHVKEITETTKNLVNKAFKDGIAEQDSLAKLARRIERYTLGGLDAGINRRARSLLIARTETLMMSEYSKEIQLDKFPEISYEKKWNHARGVKNPRDKHVQLNGKTIPKAEKFNVNGKMMKYPGDPVGGTSENCNCSCTAIYLPIL